MANIWIVALAGRLRVPRADWLRWCWRFEFVFGLGGIFRTPLIGLQVAHWWRLTTTPFFRVHSANDLAYCDPETKEKMESMLVLFGMVIEEEVELCTEARRNELARRKWSRAFVGYFSLRHSLRHFRYVGWLFHGTCYCSDKAWHGLAAVM